MQNILLYVAVVLMWGSTWSFIPYQLVGVPAEWSVTYRFGSAALLLYVFALATRRKIALPASAVPMVALQGAFLFSINYIFVYSGTGYVTTGLVATLFSSIVIFNAFFERVFFGQRLSSRVLFAATIGFAGIGLIFWPELSTFDLADKALLGIVYVLIGTVIASLGNMTAIVNTRRELPVVSVNAHSMAVSAVITAIIAIALGRELVFSTEPSYLISLVYLVIFGSALAFGGYLVLIRRIGATPASYSAVAVPVVALAISTVVENYQWTATAVIGIILSLVGNWLILSRPSKRQQKQ